MGDTPWSIGKFVDVPISLDSFVPNKDVILFDAS
jgi:hypothetical protein